MVIYIFILKIIKYFNLKCQFFNLLLNFTNFDTNSKEIKFSKINLVIFFSKILVITATIYGTLKNMLIYKVI